MSKKYFSTKYSKIFTLNALLKTYNETQQSNNKLIIHTANGIYVGTLKEQVNYNNFDIQDDDDLITIFRKSYLKALDNYENSEEAHIIEKIEENPISITLENVELITSGNTMHLTFVEIFIDQIVGFSLGSFFQENH